jgi:hypothetical protein
MLFYLTLFLIFLYFKIARVHKKEERLTNLVVAQYMVVAVSSLLLYNYGFSHYSLWIVLLVSFIFFIVAALMVTAVQVGIFVEGKPLFGVGLLFKLMPFLAAIIVGLLLLLLF